MPKTAAPLLGVLFVAGCGAPPPAASVPAPQARAGAKLIDSGGIANDTTGVFAVKGRSIRILYRFRTMPARRSAILTLERRTDSGAFDISTSRAIKVPDALSGTETVPLLPGTYRLRVQADAIWSAQVYEPTP